MIRYYARLRGVVERRDFEGAARRGVASSWRLRLALRLVGVCVAAVAAVSAVFVFLFFWLVGSAILKRAGAGDFWSSSVPLSRPSVVLWSPAPSSVTQLPGLSGA